MKRNIHTQALEDNLLRKQIEKILVQKRGYVFKMPKAGSKVISLMSGGLDTTLVTALLLDKYKLEVYPIHYKRPYPAADSSSVMRSVAYFSNYFKKRYPNQFHDPKIIDLEFPSQELFLKNTKLGWDFVNKKLKQRQGVPFQPSVFVYDAINYIYTLEKNEKKKIRTIFLGTLSTNVDVFAYESLASYRALNLEICTMLNDFSWQCTAYPIEISLGNYLDKAELIRSAQYLDLPMEYTRTCQLDSYYHCGECILCRVRKEGFREAGIVDKTIYENERRDIFGRFFGKYIATRCIKRNKKYFKFL